jgi:uncharacterized membrane protein
MLMFFVVVYTFVIGWPRTSSDGLQMFASISVLFVATLFAALLFRRHVGEAGEARFDTRNNSDRDN